MRSKDFSEKPGFFGPTSRPETGFLRRSLVEKQRFFKETRFLWAHVEVSDADLERLKKLLPGATSLLLQLEIPLEVVQRAAFLACEAGVRVILDPAPARSDWPLAEPSERIDLDPLIDIITPNEVEASQLVGFAVYDTETAILAAQQLQQRGVKNVIVKLGDRGVVAVTTDRTLFVPAFVVEAIDTVAAGDAFNGGLAAALEVVCRCRRRWCGGRQRALCALLRWVLKLLCAIGQLLMLFCSQREEEIRKREDESLGLTHQTQV